MKTFIFSYIILLSSFSNCSGQNKIGENQNGKYVITKNQDSLIRSANKILESQNLKPNLSTVIISEDYVVNTNQKYYIIKFTNDDNTIKLVQLLDLVKGDFLTQKVASTVVCSGCRKGCDPKRYVDGDGQIEFYCSDCTWGTTTDCKKSVSQSSTEL